MLNRIKAYFDERKKRKQLSDVLRLLYSDTIYSLEKLVRDLKLDTEVEILEYYFIITCATQLTAPFTKDDITQIFEKQIWALIMYVDSNERRREIQDLAKGLAETSLNKFNAEMNFLRQLYNDNKYSRHGMLFSMMKAKGRPLNLEERNEVESHYIKIKAASEKADSLIKEAGELFKKEFPSD